jgi:hypothetical protein
MWSKDRFSIMSTTMCFKASRPGGIELHLPAGNRLVELPMWLASVSSAFLVVLLGDPNLQLHVERGNRLGNSPAVAADCNGSTHGREMLSFNQGARRNIFIAAYQVHHQSPESWIGSGDVELWPLML